MLVVISPAKSLDLDSKVQKRNFTQPEFLADSSLLVKDLKKLNPEQLSDLMHISSNLGQLNYERFANWQTPFDRKNARPAILTFNGDVYLGLKAGEFTGHDLNYAQKHLRILSGLYGLLKPLDLMQAYRLEMGTRFANERGKDLYRFWGDKLTLALNKEMEGDRKKVLINLASNEYFSSIQPPSLDAEIVTPVFKDFSNGEYRVLSFFAKQARGMMAAYIIKNRINTVRKLKSFDAEGYRYCPVNSTATKLVFLREKQA
jgi:cytoplasmic iron level regulating protein YaaA (DUF328/UPF0246 family)